MAMIKHTGDLLSVERGILVHGCNSIGLMGAGLALAVKNKFPDAFKAYQQCHRSAKLRLGQIIPVRIGGLTGDPKLFIVNAITQNGIAKYKGDVVVDYDAISTAFQDIYELATSTGLPVHFPLIGCGLAGGSWPLVSDIIEQELGPHIEKHLWVL